MKIPQLEVQRNGQSLIMVLKGEWSLATFSDCSEIVSKQNLSSEIVQLDFAATEKIDTAGSKLINNLVQRVLNSEILLNQNLILQNYSAEQKRLFELVQQRVQKFELTKFESQKGVSQKQQNVFLNKFSRLGLLIVSYFNQLFGFLGLVAISFLELIRKPFLFRPKEVVNQVEEAFVKSIPVVSLVTFLIGVVVAYLMAMQLEKYGGHIFVVNGVALAMCRELSPVIVALVMAGRSGSAYTAQIGAMKLNEEVDAITTLGLSVQQVLVIPRIIALIISMPLLVFIGDIVGIIGGLMVADSYLGITGTTFIERLRTALAPRHFMVGMIKAPVFAAVIAIIGCRRGLNAEMNARSVGLSTTATVVESIVLVIILNAMFAVLFARIGL